MYPDFVVDAEAEGDAKATALFKQIAEVEGVHANLYQERLAQLEADAGDLEFYVCPVCGNVTVGRPEKCEICNVLGSKFFVAE